jgi:hypothetical protein
MIAHWAKIRPIWSPWAEYIFLGANISKAWIFPVGSKTRLKNRPLVAESLCGVS